MNNQILFAESQKFKKWWIWLIILSINLFCFFGVYKQIVEGQPFGNKPMSDTELVITLIITLLITFLLINTHLDTIIKEDGIYVRFFPLHIKFKYYTWDSITKCYIRQYSALREYGGWGLRIGLFGKGKAYNVSGNKGLQLVFSDHRKLLIGTNKAEQLSETLNKTGRIKQ